MRRCLVFLLAAAGAVAEEDLDLARRVDELVRELGAPTAEARTLARFRLASYGEKVRPMLESVVSDDPEVRRSIRQLTRTAGTLLLELLPPPEVALKIGAPLTLDVQVVNNTDQKVQLLPEAARQGAKGPFRIRVGGKTLVALGFDQVNWGGEGAATILPGASRRFRLSLDGNSSPLRRPALYDISAVFDGQVAFGYGDVEPDASENRVLESAPVQIHVLGRKAEELERALDSENAREREAAARELSLRDDDAVVPVLRRRAKEPLLRLAAIRRLGAVGAAEDFDVIFAATRDENADVRRAAVIGLSKYRTTKARSRLLLLASDQELQGEAIRALKGHKHHATVECYIKLLSAGHCTPESIKQIRATLYEWTGQVVDERASEIRDFRTWWEEHRVRWAEENASGK
ncbi:MAG: HEAT repeat domain-containing protein [Planctomycetota bacterium]